MNKNKLRLAAAAMITLGFVECYARESNSYGQKLVELDCKELLTRLKYYEKAIEQVYALNNTINKLPPEVRDSYLLRAPHPLTKFSYTFTTHEWVEKINELITVYYGPTSAAVVIKGCHNTQ